MMHTLDLAICTDTIASSLVVCSGGQNEKLNELRQAYFTWCKDLKLPDRATHKLFSLKVLKPSNEYASISQKFIKAAAARIMCYWVCGVVHQLVLDHPGERYYESHGRTL